MLVSRDPEQLQEALSIIVGLFECVRLQINTTKTKVMTCAPEEIRTHHQDIIYNCMQEGLVASSDSQNCSVDCAICGQTLRANTISHHFETKHGMFCSQVINHNLLVKREPVVYKTLSSVRGTDGSVQYRDVQGRREQHELSVNNLG